MAETPGDVCVLYRRNQEYLEVLTILQINDSFGHGSVEFLNDEQDQSTRFQQITAAKPHHKQYCFLTAQKSTKIPNHRILNQIRNIC